MPTIINKVEVLDIRFPTSKSLDGSDAMNLQPDYSATYVILHTDNLKGHGLTFTIGRGNELCVEAVKSLSFLVEGQSMEHIINDMRGFWSVLTGDSQLRWVGPEKGVIHLATAAIVNAVWDLYAKMKSKPLWQLLADMTPEELVNCVDFTYITDVLTPEEAVAILKNKADTKSDRIAELRKKGYPAYTTSAGWLGYSEEKIRKLSRQAVAEGWQHLKMKVGTNIQEDMKRASIIREEIGSKTKLMMDANQVWGVEEAIANIHQLAEFDIWWMEEPTHPDDVIGHAAIKQEVGEIKVATGEHCHNRIMFKQLFQAKAIDICQIDVCRLGGVNEALVVMLMAAKFGIPICPHAGGVGLCEYVQHLSILDYVAISGSLEDRIIEYVDHLHEHFKDPVKIKEAHYQVPENPGFSIEMKEESIKNYNYISGKIWQ